MDALFACTKCHSRHPFEELSDGKQLCKNCRNNYPTVKCTYCRAEFQQEDKNGTCSICKKCAHNVKHYGKPKACEYCSIIAAFIGNKCQRCTNCEKRYGAPQTCEQCKQQCAFDRHDDSRKKVDGKLLCWLCTMAYKRVLAKTKTKGSLGTSLSGSQVTKENRETKSENSSPAGVVRLKSSVSSSSLSILGSSGSKQSKGLIGSSSSSRLSSAANAGTQSRKSLESSKDKESSRDRDKDKKEDKSSTSSSSSSSGGQKHKADSSDTKSKDSSDSGASGTKKPKLEKTSNGLTQSKNFDPLSDFSGTDNLIAITQLREEVESLKKQLQAKDSQILDREKKLTELKAQNYESEKDMRNKISIIQKKHDNVVIGMQEKTRDLQKQLAKSNKS